MLMLYLLEERGGEIDGNKQVGFNEFPNQVGAVYFLVDVS